MIIYTYVGYPLLLCLVSHLCLNPIIKGDEQLFVSIVISAWNEGDVIEKRIRNLLEQDYPFGKIEILI